MDEYDETSNIESLLWSAVRGDSANQLSMTADNPQPEAEDLATRQRRIWIGNNAFDSLHPLMEEQQSNEERVALLNAVMPEVTDTSTKESTDTDWPGSVERLQQGNSSTEMSDGYTHLMAILIESDLHDNAAHSDNRICTRALQMGPE